MISVFNVGNVHVFNPPMEGDKVRFPNGEEWYVKGEMTGWELRRDYANWRTVHTDIHSYKAMVDFCRAIRRAAENLLHCGTHDA